MDRPYWICRFGEKLLDLSKSQYNRGLGQSPRKLRHIQPEVFRNIFKRKKHVENRLKGVQSYLDRVDFVQHTLFEKELQQEYNHILLQEEMLWYKKSREQWVKFGDKNNSFFHAQTIIRRKRNIIHRLQLPNGIWTSDHNTLKEEAQKYFKKLFYGNQSHHNRIFHEGAHPSIHWRLR